jgi:hypothetical protein
MKHYCTLPTPNMYIPLGHVFIFVQHRYQDAESLGTRAHIGLFTWYYGGGYRLLLPNDETEAKLTLEQLKAYKWFDEGTRAVFITSYMYSNSLQTLAFVQYVIELPAAGGAIIGGKIQCMKLAQL